MTTKLVCRVFTADGALLGDTTHWASVRGDATLRASDAVTVPMRVDGVAALVSWHWCDLNVETRTPLPPVAVRRANGLTVAQRSDVLIRLGEMPGPLPAITMDSVAIGIPVGQLGARG